MDTCATLLPVKFRQLFRISFPSANFSQSFTGKSVAQQDSPFYYYTRTRLNKTLMKKRISFVSPSLFRAPAGARATRPLLFAFAAFALAIPKSLVTSKTVSTISFADTRVAFTTLCDRIQPITDYAWCGLRFFHGEGRLDIMDHDSHPNFRR